MWTSTEENHQPFAGHVKVRGVLNPNNAAAWKAGKLSWMSADGEVELIDPPTYIGQPEDYIPNIPAVKLPEPQSVSVDMLYNWPALI